MIACVYVPTDDEQENVNAKMAKEQRLMEKVYRNSGNGKGICMICLLVAALVVVIILLSNFV